MKGIVRGKIGPSSAPLWLSYAPDLCSLSHFITSFLNDLCAISLSILQVPVLQGLCASHWGNWHEENWCQLLDSEWDCEHPWPLMSASGASGVLASATGASSNFNLQSLEQRWCQCLEKSQMCVFVKLGDVVCVPH